jgi:hypothetical protein
MAFPLDRKKNISWKLSVRQEERELVAFPPGEKKIQQLDFPDHQVRSLPLS